MAPWVSTLMENPSFGHSLELFSCHVGMGNSSRARSYGHQFHENLQLADFISSYFIISWPVSNMPD